MYSPEGYITPRRWLGQIERTLSNDRVFPAVLEEACVRPYKIPAGERPHVLAALGQLLLQHMCDELRHELRGFDQDHLYRLDDWLLKYSNGKPTQVAQNAASCTALVERLKQCRAFICGETWTVDIQDEQIRRIQSVDCFGKARKLQGWSICFPESSLPRDLGTALKDAATAISREGKTKRTGGRPEKVGALVDAIKVAFPDGLQGTPAKKVDEVIRPNLQFPFSDKTLRKAMSALESSLESTDS